MKSKLHKVEHENSDLRFLNTQYLHKLRSIEKESKDKSKKILELQEKNFQAVIQTPSGNKQILPFRRQRLDIDCMLPPSSGKHSAKCVTAAAAVSCTDPYMIDMIKLADERIEQLQSELDVFKQNAEILDTKVSNYKSQVIQDTFRYLHQHHHRHHHAPSNASNSVPTYKYVNSSHFFLSCSSGRSVYSSLLF